MGLLKVKSLGEPKLNEFRDKRLFLIGMRTFNKFLGDIHGFGGLSPRYRVNSNKYFMYIVPS